MRKLAVSAIASPTHLLINSARFFVLVIGSLMLGAYLEFGACDLEF
jgi:hypothetical protein